MDLRWARLLAACWVTLSLAACGSTPSIETASRPPSSVPASLVATEQPTATPTMTPSAVSSAPKCLILPTEAPYYALVGWVGNRVVVLSETFPSCGERFELLSADPAVGTWRSEAVFTSGMPGDAATDGVSVAFPLEDAIAVTDASGTTRTIAKPSGLAGDWDSYGLPALPGGGYLVVGVEELLRVASDGSGLTADPLPTGFVAVAPTSDPDRFIITPTSDARVAYGLGRAPFRAYLWDRATGQKTLVARSVAAVRPAVPALGLAFLVSGDNGSTTWSLLRRGGSTRKVATTDGGTTLAPQGTLAVTTGTPDQPSRETRVVDPVTGQVIVDVAALPATGSAWAGDRVAILAQTQTPRTAEPAVFVVQGTRVVRIPLP